MIKRALLALALLLAWPSPPASAQGVGGNASISATTTSSRVALPSTSTTYRSVIIAPATGTSVEVFYRLGDSTVLAVANTSAALPSGGICLNVGPNTNVAAITGSGTASVRLTQLSSCTFFAGGSGGGGGGGSVAITSPVDGSGNVSVNCAVGCSGGTFNNNADNVATSTTNGQVAAWGYVWDGTNWDRQYGDSTNGAFVNVKTSVLPTGAATAANQATEIAGIGVIGDPAWTSGNGSLIAIAKTIAGNTGAAIPAQAGTVVIGGVNIAAINNITPLMGNGVTGTGSQRVTIASDNTAISVNATLGTETTKVIGTVRNLGNAGAIFDVATGAAVPANALQVGMAQGGNLIALTGTSGNLNVQCANCSGSGVSTADEATFTAGSSLFAGTGGFFQTTATSNALTNGQQGMWQMTSTRAGFVNLRNGSGTEVGTSAAEIFVGGRGTAGTAAGGVLTVQGATSMTKLLVTPDSVALPANQSVNVSQINAVTPLMGNGVTGTGSQRVTIASDNTAFSTNSVQSGTWTVQPGNTANTTAWLVKQNDGTNSIVLDPCQTVAKTYTPISITTATTTRIVAPTSAKKTYVCYILLTSAAADNIGIVEGTGGTCGTGTAGVIGGATAANGPNFAANGGISMGNGGYAIAATAGTNVDLCLITSAATPLAGMIAWVQQ